MTERNEFEKRTDAMLSRWAKGKLTALRLTLAGACLVSLGFFVGGAICWP